VSPVNGFRGIAMMLLDMRVAGVGFKTWSIPGKADVEGVFVKGEAFMQQPLLQMFLGLLDLIL
jgi:hypothetical protein